MNQTMGVDHTTGKQAHESEMWRARFPFSLDFVDVFTEARVSRRMPAKAVQTVALARYIRALDMARVEVAGSFNESEVMLLLHHFDYPVLIDEMEVGLADVYHEHFRYNNDDQHGPLSPDSAEYKLCEKLLALTRCQELAVIDIIECAVDNPSPIEYAVKHLCAPKKEMVTP